MTSITQWSKWVAISAISLAAFGLQACGDDDSGPTPSDQDGGASGSGGKGEAGKDGGSGGTKGGSGGKGEAGQDAGGSGGGGSGGGAGTDAGTDGGAGDGGTSDGGGNAECSGDDGCYSCEPKTNAQILNHCTDATCQPYDNSSLTKLLSDGGLPPLPK